MKIIAKLKYARSSVQKVNLVANVIRKKKIPHILELLKFSNTKASYLINKVLLSAIANAEHNYGIDSDNLKIESIIINKGPMMKRIIPRAKGRANKILKRTVHITIILSKK